MAEYIEREALIREIISNMTFFIGTPDEVQKHDEQCNYAISCIEDALLVDAAEVVHGQWIKPRWKNSNYCCDCSRCGGEAMHKEYQWHKKGIYPICPNCGVKMDGGIEMNERQILGRAISFYGSEIQRVIAIEELSELQKELCKSLRSGADRPHIAEEIADVQIMLEQMMMLYECHEDVSVWRHKKVNRLLERLIHDGGIEKINDE